MDRTVCKCSLCGTTSIFDSNLRILGKCICRRCEGIMIDLKTTDQEYEVIKDRIKAMISN